MLDNLMHNFASPTARAAIVVLTALAATPAQSEEASGIGLKAPSVDMRAGPPRGTWYPAKARRENVEGQLLVEFALDSAGSPGDVKVVPSDHPQMLEAAAIGFVKRLRFRMPEGWGAEGSARHRIYVRFDICPFDPPSPGPNGAEVLTITACRAP